MLESFSSRQDRSFSREVVSLSLAWFWFFSADDDIPTIQTVFATIWQNRAVIELAVFGEPAEGVAGTPAVNTS